MGNMIPDPTALDRATDSELIDELSRRHLAILIVLASEPRRQPTKEAASVYHRGGFHAAAGLAKYANLYFTRAML